MTAPNLGDLALVRKLTAEKAGLEDEIRALKQGGGGGTSGTMDPAVPLKDYVDARDDAVESRLVTKLDKLATKSTIWGAVATSTAIILGVAAFAGDRFDSGMSASGMVASVRSEQRVVDARQDRKLSAIDRKIDELLRRTDAPAVEATKAP